LIRPASASPGANDFLDMYNRIVEFYGQKLKTSARGKPATTDEDR
jgi:hypothetical protein